MLRAPLADGLTMDITTPARAEQTEHSAHNLIKLTEKENITINVRTGRQVKRTAK
jgi:hypothetical protein